MRKNLILCLLMLSGISSRAQDALVAQERSEANPLQEVVANIRGEDIASYLNVLASDEFQGRETGHPGIAKAADFIESKFKEFGIPPVPSLQGYQQELIFSKVRMKSATLTVGDSTYLQLKDVAVIPSQMPSDQLDLSTDEIVFLGYGIDDSLYSDYATAGDLDGKVIMIYAGEPLDEDENSILTGTKERSSWTYDFGLKLNAARDHNVAHVILISQNFRRLAGMLRRQVLDGDLVMGELETQADLPGHWVVSPNLAREIMGSKSKKVFKSRDRIPVKGKLKPVVIDVPVSGSQEREIEKTPGSNVLAYIEGTDPDVKNELIVVTAHYDHVGYRGTEIFNGADDNASGTSGVMEVAQAFQEAKNRGLGPRRSVLCMLVTGEEKGLLGSQYYTEFPLFPLENTVANVNMDMIGRMDNNHDDANYIYVIGSDKLSTELHEINERMNATYTDLELDYTYNSDSDPNKFYYRSDHYNFAKNGIPAIFYFSGVHEDYHRPTDTADKIMFDRAAKIAQLAFYTSWELANRDDRIRVDVEPPPNIR